MDEKLAPCCTNLPKLTQRDLAVNVGDNHSPSLYDEDIFDEKRFNELMDDPMLNSGQLTTSTSTTGVSGSSSTTTNPTSTSIANPIGQQQQQQQNVQWNNDYYQQPQQQQNVFPNGGGNQFYPTTSQPAVQIPPTSMNQYPTASTSNWQSAQSIDPVVVAQQYPPTASTAKPLSTSNVIASGGGVVQPAPDVIGLDQQQQQPRQQRPPKHTMLARVKPEPRDSIDHDREEFDYSPESHDASSTLVSRGAVYAREYRRKTKSRITKLEHDNDRLQRENDSLKTAYRESKTRAESLGREVVYLRQVIANDGALSTLLNAVVSNTSGLKFQVPLVTADRPSASNIGPQSIATNPALGSKRALLVDSSAGGKPSNGSAGGKQRKLDENEVRKVKESIQKSGDTPGICMHVNGDMVSIEFCPRCNRDARRGCADMQGGGGQPDQIGG